jgi:NAD(P)-dependent dehydrogenase (short-subunit alcohol dehydrogenase family)
VSAFGRLDIMVNNAGIETRTSILDTTEDQYDRVMAINLKSAFFGAQIAARQMIKQGGGGRTSTSARCMKTGQCQAIPLIACRKAACAC